MNREQKLQQALQWALEWIDAVPGDAKLPTMPGFDRDYVDDLLSARQAQQEFPLSAAQIEKVRALTLDCAIAVFDAKGVRMVNAAWVCEHLRKMKKLSFTRADIAQQEPASNADQLAAIRAGLEAAAKACEVHAFGSPVAAHAIRAIDPATVKVEAK